MDSDYKFSVVIPFYNSARWLNQTIQSVITQDIGLRNVQLILVDDGSIDESLNICKKYEYQYPNNIVILCKENNGVASARNYAIPYIKGKYVEFLDSDDFISSNALTDVYNFFNENDDKINVVSIPMYYFEGREGEHYLNEKFVKGNRIIDLNKEPMSIFVHANSIFIKSELMEKYKFDESLVSCEDGKLDVQLLLENFSYGVVSTCRYNYRLRANEKTSLSQTAKKKKDWYIKQLINYPLWAYDYCTKKIGYIPDFVKYMMASHLQWRFKKNPNDNNILTEKENVLYSKALKLSVMPIDDYIIDSLTQIPDEQKKYMKEYKYRNILRNDKEIGE